MFKKLSVLLVALPLAVGTLSAPASASASDVGGTVFALTNADRGNEVVVYDRAADGTLDLIDAVATGGVGRTTEPDDALGAQAPLVASPDGRWLFAVNAGSDTISTFRVNRDELELKSVTPSGGTFPASLTIRDDVLYVLNAGGEGNVSGFELRRSGRLDPIAGSSRSLDVGGDNPPFFLASPAQVGFTPTGEWLIVTIKGVHPVHEIRLFPLDRDGRISGAPVSTVSDDTLPFSFTFDGDGRLLVGEPFGNQFDGTPAPGLSAVSSYEINPDGTLSPVSASVANLQTATCWIAVTPNGRFVYTSNNVSGTISVYEVLANGELALVDGSTASTGPSPVDLAITPDGRFVYNVDAGGGTVSAYRIDPQTGELTRLGATAGLPDDGSAVGIVAL